MSEKKLYNILFNYVRQGSITIEEYSLMEAYDAAMGKLNAMPLEQIDKIAGYPENGEHIVIEGVTLEE